MWKVISFASLIGRTLTALTPRLLANILTDPYTRTYVPALDDEDIVSFHWWTMTKRKENKRSNTTRYETGVLLDPSSLLSNWRISIWPVPSSTVYWTLVSLPDVLITLATKVTYNGERNKSMRI